jgi:exopolysaccharide biosynthesis polyprenyl glycosylphosphotransferase
MKRSELVFGILRVPLDALAVLSSLILAFFLRTKNIDLIPGRAFLETAQTLPILPVFLNDFIVPSILLFIVVAALLKLYIIRITLGYFREVSRIILTTIVWVGIIMGWYFFVQKQLFYSRAILLHGTVFVILFVTTGRTVMTFIQRSLLKRGIGVRTVLSLGNEPLSAYVENFLRKDPRYTYLGHADVTSVADVREPRLQKEAIDLILQTDPSSSDETNAVIDYCRSNHIGYAFLPPVLIDVPHLLSVYRFGSVPVLRFHPTPLDGWGAVEKRMMDIVLSTMALVLFSPLFLLIATVIKLDSRGPLIYKSRRIGRRKKFLMAMKFRSMVENADELKEDLQEQSHRDDGPLFKMKNDPRVTRVGTFLRRFSLDELPQILNVIRGEMSLVGPRPHLPEEVSTYTDFQQRVFAVLPGITGLAQISGRSDLKFDEEVRLDLQYIEEWSPWMDLWILWRTIWVVLKGDGAD